jgi:hypothetical protein
MSSAATLFRSSAATVGCGRELMAKEGGCEGAMTSAALTVVHAVTVNAYSMRFEISIL